MKVIHLEEATQSPRLIERLIKCIYSRFLAIQAVAIWCPLIYQIIELRCNNRTSSAALSLSSGSKLTIDKATRVNFINNQFVMNWLIVNNAKLNCGFSGFGG